MKLFFSTLLTDHASLAEWIVGAALLSLVLGLAGAGAASLMRKSHPALRSLVLMVLVLAAPVVMIMGMPAASGNWPESAGAGQKLPGGLPAVFPAESYPEFSMGLGEIRKPVSTGSTLSAGRNWELPASWQGTVIVAGCLWLGGTLTAAGFALLGHFRLRRWRMAALRTDSFEGLPVLISTHCPQPMCAGLFRPVILLPSRLEGMPEPGRLAVLRHEAAHIRHGDLWLLNLQWLAAGLHWWNPLMHRLNRQLSAALEERADLAVLRAGCPAVDYAQCLLNCARQLSGAGRGGNFVPGLAMAKSVPAVKRRILSVLSGRHADQPGKWRRAASGLVAVAVLLPLLASVPSPVFAEAADLPVKAGPDLSENEAAVPIPPPASEPVPSPATPAASVPAQADNLNPGPERATSPTTPNPPLPLPAAHEHEPTPETAKGARSNAFDVFRKLLAKASLDSEKKGDEKRATYTCTANSITLGPDDRSYILVGSAKLEFSGMILEAEKVAIEIRRKEAPSNRDFYHINAYGKFRLKFGDQLVEGKSDQSTIELNNGGNPIKFTDAIVRTIDPALSKSPAGGAPPNR